MAVSKVPKRSVQALPQARGEASTGNTLTTKKMALGVAGVALAVAFALSPTVRSVLGVGLALLVVFGPLWWLNQRQVRAKLAEERALGRCQCGKQLRAVSKITGGGWVLIVAGLFLAPVLIGFFLIGVGMSKKEHRVECPKHGQVLMTRLGSASEGAA